MRPGRLGLNVFIYDSDTQDKTGQTRLGWSTWGGVQGDPYRWGRATLDGYTPPPELPAEPRDPVFPREAALSVDSPQSIAQAARDGVALAGGPQAVRRDSDRAARPRLLGDGRAAASGCARRRAGVAHVFAIDADGRALGSRTSRSRARAGPTCAVPVSGADAVRRGGGRVRGAERRNGQRQRAGPLMRRAGLGSTRGHG